MYVLEIKTPKVMAMGVFILSFYKAMKQTYPNQFH
jgi:hypothetical protein